MPRRNDDDISSNDDESIEYSSEEEDQPKPKKVKKVSPEPREQKRKCLNLQSGPQEIINLGKRNRSLTRKMIPMNSTSLEGVFYQEQEEFAKRPD